MHTSYVFSTRWTNTKFSHIDPRTNQCVKMIFVLVAILLFCEFVRGKLVVDSLTELMIGQGDDMVYDVQRIISEGDMVNKTLEESECEGVMEEIQTWEVITIEEGKEMSNLLEVAKLIDLTQDTMQITNVREPWVKGSVIIRY